MRHIVATLFLLTASIGCSTSHSAPDSAPPDAMSGDGAMDATIPDGSTPDGGPEDSSVVDDADVADSGPVDSGPADSGPVDAGPADSGTPDAAGDADPADSAPDAPLDTGPACPAPSTLCGDVCVDVDTDLAHCGACDAPCLAPDDASATCEAGACVASCDAGRGDCNSDLADPAGDGCETDLLTDEAFCSSCRLACRALHACVAGACVPPRTVFVTSEFNTGDFGGVAGGDAICQRLAVAAGLEGTYFAWLGSDDTSPDERFERHTGFYVRTDGEVIAEGWGDLTDGELLAPIALTENAEVVSTTGAAPCDVFTGLRADGTRVTLGGDCDNWTSWWASAVLGTSEAVGPGWSGCGSVGGACRTPQPHYCFQQ